MDPITLSMALVDFIPVILCAVVMLFQIRIFRTRMQPFFHILFILGAFLLVAGGTLKALWKLLLALKIGDYQLLSDQFLPVSGTAFVLLAIAAICMVTGTKRSEKQFAFMAASRIPFIAMMFFGMTGWYMSLAVLSFRLKKKGAGGLFIAAWIIMSGTSVLSAKFDNGQSIMHWVAEGANILVQILLLSGTSAIHKALVEQDMPCNP
ncbi:MAG: hypothetical protein IK130_10060 [Oscillospiraceae bacterium]|nr:hypothetical protein [Oscillospiraceae bacterium]